MAVMHGNFNFEFVWEILLIQPTIQPRERHIVIKNVCRNIHATQKKLDVTRWSALHCIDSHMYVEKTGPRNSFRTMVRIFDDNGSPKTTPYS